MSYKKQKKIRKLKQRHILPRIIMMLVFVSFVCVLDAVIMYMTLQNIFGNKILEGFNQAEKVAGIFEEQSSESEFNRKINEYRKIISDITSICVVDGNNNVIKKYGNEEPDFSHEAKIHLSQRDISIIPDAKDSDIFDKNGNVVIYKAPIQKLMMYVQHENELERIKERQKIDEWSRNMSVETANQDWINLKCWFITSIDNTDNKACVRGNIRVSYFELFSIIVAFGFTIIISLIFCLLQLIELVKMFIDQRRVFTLLHTDLVTGGNNRTKFTEYVNRIIKRKGKKQYAVILLRLDKYRNYCMYYGQSQGEELLEKMYDTIDRSRKSRKELVAHTDRGDFALLLMYDDKYALNQRMNDIICKIDALKPDIKLYFSVGIAPVDGRYDADEFYNEAAVARRAIKEDDEIRISWFNEEMKAAQMWERKVENDMEAALANHEFQVYLQPKYSTKEEVLSGAEALVRWIHPTEGFVPPGKFIPIFEKNGFILKLDDFMLEEVAKIQSNWLSQGKKIVPISVNVSRAHFTRDDLAEHICKVVDSYNVPHEFIELELTESAFFDDKDVLLKTVNKMKGFGFHVSMDDFGAGYSSLNSLKELPLDVVKLDAEFFRGADDLERANLIVSRTIDLAKNLGMTIVAEGIETREQVDFLAGQDCDLIQGFYFAKPMPVDDFDKKAFGEEE